MTKFLRKRSRFLALILALILSSFLLTGCFSVDLVEGIVSEIHRIFDKNVDEGKHSDKDDDVYVPEERKDKPAKPDRDSSANASTEKAAAEEMPSEEIPSEESSLDEGASKESSGDTSPEQTEDVRNLEYVNDHYLLGTQQLYVSLDGVDFSGPAFDLCTAVDEYDYYVCNDSFWGYGDHGCVWEIETYIEVPDGSGKTVQEDINVYLYLDSPSIPNSDGTPTMYTNDTIHLLAEKFDVDPSEIKTMESGGTVWHYANDENEFFAGSESFDGVYAYLEYDCFIDEMETDPLVLQSLEWQFEAFLSRLQLFEAREHRSEMGEQALLIKTSNGGLYGPLILWDDNVINRDQEFEFDDWFFSEESYVGGFSGEIEADLYFDEEVQLLATMSDDEIGAILMEEMLQDVLRQDTDNECIISDIRWIEGNGVRWALCSSAYPTAFDSQANFNYWEECAFGITAGGEVIDVYWDFWLNEYSGLTDEMYQEICSAKLAEFENWLSLTDYH